MVGLDAARCTVALAIFAACGFFPSFAQAQQEAGAINYESARFGRRLEAVRSSGEISLDGALDEPAWSSAPVARDFLQNDPREGQAATFDTDVRVLYDDDALYFGVLAQDDDPSRLIVNDLKKDYNTDGSDGFR